MATASLIQQFGQKRSRWSIWFRRQSLRRSLNRAIAHIYPSFARQYPEWVNYLFDEPFLKQHAFALLARYLEYKVVPTPFELVQVWAEQFAWFNLEMKERHVAQLMPVASDFLRRLQKELFD